MNLLRRILRKVGESVEVKVKKVGQSTDNPFGLLPNSHQVHRENAIQFFPENTVSEDFHVVGNTSDSVFYQ